MNQGKKSGDRLFVRRIAKVLPGQEELEKLISRRRVRVYLGIDPTGGQLHIGHAIGLKKLMEFAEAGHEAILLFGTGTVLVGDPSQRNSSRSGITQAEIDQNIQTWKDQVAPIVDFKKVTIKQNGDWITKMGIKDVINVASRISAVQLFKRESFTRRLKTGDTVWYHETMYPLLQGYDSVVMDVDVEIGGTDQEFNMLVGRELLKKMKSKDKFVVTTPMILGTDGQQMSKSSGNCVWLQDPPSEMYGKLMSVPDGQVVSYLEMCTDVELNEVQKLAVQLKDGVNPRDVKMRMALEVTKIWHGESASQAAAAAWTSQFSEGGLPENVPVKKVSGGKWKAEKLLVAAGLATSGSEARRLLGQGGVRLNQQKIDSGTISVSNGDVLQAGKRRFVKLVV